MNFKTTLALLVILALVLGGGYIYTTNRLSKPPDKVAARQEQFYLVDLEDIQKLQVDYRGQSQKFFRSDDSRWYFDTPAKAPVNMNRWGGITLLVSGPRFDRVISNQATDLARYGLQDPALVIRAKLASLGDITIRIGDKTPDGKDSYALFQDERSIHLIASAWGDVLARLVTEPPIATPTPITSPTPEGSFG